MEPSEAMVSNAERSGELRAGFSTGPCIYGVLGTCGGASIFFGGPAGGGADRDVNSIRYAWLIEAYLLLEAHLGAKVVGNPCPVSGAFPVRAWTKG